MQRVILLFVAIAATFLVLTMVPAHATFHHGTNGRIAYSLDKGSGEQIYTIKHDGTGKRQLTHVNGAAVGPDWSPNGRKIVFEHDHPNGQCSVEVMNTDGTNMRDLTGTRHQCDSSPAFMPGGRRVVFMAADGDAIMSMNLRGGDRRVIYRSQLYKKEPQVSPDGRKVLFEAEKDLPDLHKGYDENEKALYSVRMNGTDLKIVVPFDLDVCACGGDWAPNGKRIAFNDNAGAADEPQTLPTNLATIRPDGSGLRFVTHNAYRPYPRIAGNKVYLGSGSYSPDGRWILFKTIRDDKYKLWKIHPNGTHKHLIARFKFEFFTRDWGPRPT